MFPLEQDQLNELRERVFLLESQSSEMDRALRELRRMQATTMELLQSVADEAAQAYIRTAPIGGLFP